MPDIIVGFFKAFVDNAAAFDFSVQKEFFAFFIEFCAFRKQRVEFEFFFFIYRLSKLTRISDVSAKSSSKENVKIWEVYGVLFFGASGKIEDLLGNNFANLPDVLILNLERLVQIDTSGLDGLVHLNQKFINHGKHLLLCNLHQQPRAFLRRAGFISQVGAANVCLDLSKALERADIILENKK